MDELLHHVHADVSMRNRQYSNVGASQTGQRDSFIIAVEMHLHIQFRNADRDGNHQGDVLVAKQMATCSRRRFFAVIFITGPAVVRG